MMADFYKAYEQTMKHEGGYNFDADDKGGETYKGVSRRYNPNWPGWDMIDRHKREIELFPSILDSDEMLEIEVQVLYRNQYWNKILGDYLPNQPVANALFDTCVILGDLRAGLFLQQSLNFLNRNGRLYPELVEDGRIGPKTLNVLHTYFETSSEDYLIKSIHILRGNHHFQFMRRSPEQEKYARGWLNRLTCKTA